MHVILKSMRLLTSTILFFKSYKYKCQNYIFFLQCLTLLTCLQLKSYNFCKHRLYESKEWSIKVLMFIKLLTIVFYRYCIYENTGLKAFYYNWNHHKVTTMLDKMILPDRTFKKKTSYQDSYFTCSWFRNLCLLSFKANSSDEYLPKVNWVFLLIAFVVFTLKDFYNLTFSFFGLSFSLVITFYH